MQVLKERPITAYEALDVLQKRQKETGELSYEQQHTLEYLEDLNRLEKKDADKLYKELTALGLSDANCVKLVDLLPKKEDETKLLVGSGVSDDVVKKATEVVKEYRKSAKEPTKIKKVEAAEQAPAEGEAPKAEGAEGSEEAASEKQEETSE